MDLRRFPRVMQLLGEAEARAHRERSDDADSSLLELGRYVQWLMQQQPAVWASIQEEGQALLREQLQREAEEGVEDPASDELALEPSWELPSLSSASPRDDLALAAPEAADTPGQLLEDNDVVRASISRVVLGASRHQAHGHAEPEAWLTELFGLMDVLGPPPRDVDRVNEAHRLLNATAQIHTRWATLPDTVQFALVALLGARCRTLLCVDPDDVSAQLVLNRLQQLHGQKRMGEVKGLSGGPRSDYTSWADEAERWWDTLAGRA